MASYTATQSGNWSDAATWGGGGVPGDGDTATVGAYTVTVDVDTTVGTSPNDTTTKVVDKTSSTGSLIIDSGVTFTVKGNIGGVNGSRYQLNAGASVIFDPSDSGGTPIYRFVNVGFMKLASNGTSVSRCSISVVAGHTWLLGQNYTEFTLEYTDITRLATGTISCNSANISITNCVFDSCNQQTLVSSGTTLTHNITDNAWQSSTGSGSLNIQFSGVKTSGVRSLKRNVFDKLVTHSSIGLDIEYNVFLDDFTCVAGRTWSSNRHNVYVQKSGTNGGNGSLLTGSIERNYFVNATPSGNPHFIAPTALISGDTEINQCIFEGQSPDLTDTGDCVLVIGAACNSTKIVVNNCIVLPSGYSGTDVHTGQLITVFSSSTVNNTSSQTQAYRNTCNVNLSSSGVGKRAAIAFSEASVGFANQVSAVKGNLAWCNSAGDGYLVERIFGTVDGVIAASGADYNWLYNIATDNNGRGYSDRANSPAQDLWTTGNADGTNAASAGVDDNQGSGDPDFVDSSRNLASWVTSRGYGSSYSDAITALQTSMETRIPDLVAYVFEGFKPQSSGCRNAAHDGGCVGASNYHKSTRKLSTANSFDNFLDQLFSI